MGFELKVVVAEVRDVQTFPSGFCKREVWADTVGEKFPQSLSFEFMKDKVDLPVGLRQGEVVTVSFDIRGRESGGRRYVSLAAWKAARDGGAQAPAQAPASGPAAASGDPVDVSNGLWADEAPPF